VALEARKVPVLDDPSHRPVSQYLLYVYWAPVTRGHEGTTNQEKSNFNGKDVKIKIVG
jgi:hypothetical protein